MITLKTIKKRHSHFRLSINEMTIGTGVTLIVGKNGAGKSTLLRLLATAAEPDEGSILYAGKSVVDDLPLIRREIGYLPDDIELHADMTLEQLFRYMAELKGLSVEERARDVENALSEFQLATKRRERIQRLSGGEKRRAAIGQALFGQPFFLFLDEPLNHLDIEQQKRVATYLHRYALRRTVVVSTHELSVWEGLCDAIVLLENGRVRFSGTPSEWVRHPTFRVWEGIVASYALGGWIGRYCVVRAKQRDDRRYDLRIVSEERPGTAFMQVTPTLEDGFFLQTTRL